MENLSRLEIVQLWIENEQNYLYNLYLNRNYYNEDELLNQRMIARMFNKKQKILSKNRNLNRIQ